MKKIGFYFLSLSLILSLSCSDYANDGIGDTGGVSPFGPTGGTNPLPPDLQKPNEGEFSEAKMLVNIGINVIYKNAKDFYLQTQVLENQIGKYCDELEVGIENPLSEKNVRDQWKAAMLSYHVVEAAPIGPLEDNGRLLAANIYSWPAISTCGIDEETAKLSTDGNYSPQDIVSVKGLGALEYLLFDPNIAETTLKCPAFVYPNATAWIKKPLAGKKFDRCQYMKFASRDIVRKARILEDAWSPDKSNFSKTLIDNTRYPSTTAALNALTDSMFSIEELKDNKLGKPLGIHEECKGADKKCPDMAEHPWSGLALKTVAAQLRGFRSIFWGSTNPKTQAFGFDDYLKIKSHPEVPLKMDDFLKAAINSSLALDKVGSLQSQIPAFDAATCEAEASNGPMCTLYHEVRDAGNVLKTELLVVLALQMPATFQGDID